MRLTIDPTDPTPPYEQLRRQLADLVATGALPAGERLPALRQLAGDLGLAVGTVARAYKELEAAGLLVSRRGGGTRVTVRVSADPDAERTTRLMELAQDYVLRAQALGCSEESIGDAVRHAVTSAE